MNKNWLVLSAGFALFSMFFGSGNLVFPITVGLESEGHYLFAALGIVLTGVFVPFLGVLGMSLHQGSIQSFFQCLGKRGIFWFSLLALSLMGPFGVLARCLTVAHGALQLLIPQASLPIVSLVLCLIIYFLTINKTSIIHTLGVVLTPLLLLAIVAIAFLGLKQGTFIEPAGSKGLEALKNGFFQGYQTMDLLAAFFFSNFMLQQLRQSFAQDDESSFLKVFLKASLIGAGLLSLVYLALAVLGWIYAPSLTGCPPQEMLGRIAMEVLGPFATPCVCLAVVLACLTTAMVLTSLFADFLRQEVLQNKIKHSWALWITLGISFLVSTLDFNGIAKFLGPILETIYPVLIALTVVNILIRIWSSKPISLNS